MPGLWVVAVLSRKGERASIDKVYLDLSDTVEQMLAEAPPENLEVVDDETLKSHILGLSNENGVDPKNMQNCRKDVDHDDKLLACGTVIVAELRMQVLKETEFTCSAGIAHNMYLVVEYCKRNHGEEVQGCHLPKSHGSETTFPGPRALKTIVSVSDIFPD
ncbi:UmuC domain containing protein [Parasponia andersonii]|uniref:UmuC domain containing protein n=1 Tax=Parasponia andersonii TaxID=3476 RepID=A0A2P5CR50_PARAD|nr:UmuC domain containing protein [Parasponia andersonii]